MKKMKDAFLHIWIVDQYSNDMMKIEYYKTVSFPKNVPFSKLVDRRLVAFIVFRITYDRLMINVKWSPRLQS